MFRIVHVLATVATLLACPYRCLAECAETTHLGHCDSADCCGHDEDEASGTSHREHDSPGAPCDDHDDGGCTCLCCNGGLPKSHFVEIAPATAGNFIAGEIRQPLGGVAQNGATRDRWSVIWPLSGENSGRALRSRIVSLVI